MTRVEWTELVAVLREVDPEHAESLSQRIAEKVDVVDEPAPEPAGE